MTDHERDLVLYALLYVYEGYDGRKLASTAVDKVSPADRSKIRKLAWGLRGRFNARNRRSAA
jgi:hypothetical protein